MENKYKKSKGNAGLDGVQFQLDLLIVSLLNALHTHKDWKISSENQQAGKYDDLVMELPDRSVLLQAKFKQNKKLNRDQLFSCNSKNVDFSLPKYFLSYLEIKSEFKEKTIVICTNTDVNESGLENFLTHHSVEPDSMLYYEGAIHPFFTFNKNILPDLKTSAKEYLCKNLQGKNIDKALITDENIEDFLKNLQFFSSYPSGEQLHKIIDKLLSHSSDSGLWCHTSYHEVYRKIEDWFKQPKGEYLMEVRAKAMFSEINSDKYCESLKEYKVSFKSVDFDFTPSQRIFHVKSEGGYLLQMLKIYQTLQDNKSNKVLYVDPDDDFKLQKQVIQAFELRPYAFLVMIWDNTKSKREEREITSKLRNILTNHQYKKLVLVAENNCVVAHQIGLEDVCQVDGFVKFEDLSKDSQEKLLKKKNVVFQGKKINLKELLATQKTDDYTKSLDTALLEQLIQGEEVKVGVRPLDLDEDTARCYVSRTFEKDTEEIEKKEIYSEETIFSATEKVILISDSAGMGKSTVLTKMAVYIKKKYPHLWIIRINLNDYTEVLRDSLRKNKKTISISKLLNSREETKLGSQFEESVFLMNGKIVLMLDGVDEISPDYTVLVLALLTQCWEAPNFAKIFVTTRPHMVKELKTLLKVDSFKLLPFTRSNQVIFLTNYWTHNLELDHAKKNKCERYAETLIDKMTSWIKSYGYWENHFTAIPLQLTMLAEIFEERIGWEESSDWNGCKEYLTADEVEPKLPETFNITRLYHTFIEKKRSVFIDKGNPGGNVAANQALIDQFEECLSSHRNLALKVILKEPERDLFSSYHQDNKDVKEHVLKIGIVQAMGYEFQFIHRTFAEYFIAECILKELQLHNPNVEFQKLVIHEILWKNKFIIVRAFLDKLLQGIVDTLSSDVFKNYKSFTFKTGWNPIFKLAGEGYISLLQLILKSIDFKVIKGKEIDFKDPRVKIKPKETNTLNDLEILTQKAGINIKDKNGDTPLHHSVKKNQWEMVKFLIEQGADINIKNNGGGTVLHLAVSLNQLEAVKYLVELGGDVKVRDGNGCSTLHLAAHRGGLDVVKYLVECGLDVKVRDNHQNSALHFASGWIWKANIYLQEIGVHIDSTNTWDELNTVKYLMENGVGIDKDGMGRTPLHLAAECGKSNTMKYLLECDANINDKENEGCTALHLAAKCGRLDSVEYLVKHNADINAKDNDGHTALHLSAKCGKSTTVRHLLESGADINNRDSNGRTALHLTAKWGKLNTIKHLVEFGADINNKDNDGHTPLHFAAGWGRLDIIKYLVEHSADVNVQNGDGHTVLHLAAKDSELDTVEYLVQCGVDVDVCDNNGCTPLHIAVKKNKVDTINCLVENGANVNSKDHLGHTVLHIIAKGASELGILNTVKYLVQSGADINFKDDSGNTPLHLFAAWGKLDVVKCLVEHDVDINAINNEGLTVLHLAVKGNKLDTVKYLQECGVEVGDKDKDVMKYLKQVGEGVNPMKRGNHRRKLCINLFKK